MTAVYIRDSGQIADLLERRKRLGLDLFDEVWEGVLHMAPAPHAGHQQLLLWIVKVFDAQARRHGLGNVYLPVNLREPGTPFEGPRANFRIPDALVLPPNYEIREGCVEDGALLVAEVRSPREVVAEKLDFYAARRVSEILYVDWRTLELEVYRLVGERYAIVSPDREGFREVRALALRVRRVEHDGKPSLEFEDARGVGPLPPL